MAKKWLKMFPYFNYDDINLSFILDHFGDLDDRVKKTEEKNAEQDERLDTDEADIADLKTGLAAETSAREAADNALSERITTEVGARIAGDAALNTRVDNETTAREAADTALGNRITNELGPITTAITSIQAKDQAQDNDIAGLDNRVTDLEGNEVVANPGGTGANLNSIGISGVTYLIPSGGGGGGGSTVTPNPAGVQPSDPALEALGIDALNYRMPITTAEKNTLIQNLNNATLKIDDLEEAVLDIDTRIGTVIQKTQASISIAPSISTGEVIELNNANVGVDMGLLLPPGVYQVSFSCDFDTTNYGSTPRFLGCYIRDVLHTNLARDKFSVFGTERAMITQAASVQCTTVLTVTGTGMQLYPAIRCNSSRANTGFAITDVEFTAVRLGVAG